MLASPMTFDAAHPWVAAALLVTAGPVLVILLRRTAPYGRHSAAGSGPTVGAKLGWVLMESPAALVFLAAFAAGPNAGELAPRVLAALWSLHYLYRAFLFPLRMTGRPIPLTIALGGAAFNVVNGWLNGWQVGAIGAYPAAWLGEPRFLAGVALFGLGWAINQHSDAVLLRLRGRGGYAIPHGGLYRWVSCPNYLGELLEWLGWALATWSLAGFAFFCFTFANLAPRALAHHAWYRATFADYPRDRRALFPWPW